MPFNKALTAARSAPLAISLLVIAAETSLADPCGMVPPIYAGAGDPITRVGEQLTYVFYQDGIESFVIRPGFSGKVDEFGMLIPFPTPPAIRKMPDHIFPHIAAAIDPPEVVVHVNQFRELRGAVPTAANADTFLSLSLKRDEVRVIREEAVGMYEIAVLEAGSAAALKRWMDDHGFRYPNGMDDVCEEYVQDRWCFVAVKTKGGSKQSADPRPGQREVRPEMPPNSTFDGHVQAMGFRFRTDELVVPMRLSAFNAGELRNIVYLLTDGPRRIRRIPEEYVVRQIAGSQLIKNVTDPLPLRIIGGTADDLEPWQKENLPRQRDPHAKNGAAKELFAADLRAVRSGHMSLDHEEAEKELLRIGERLGLRGSEIDRLNDESLRKQRESTVAQSLQDLRGMILTVVDGDFPRDVLASQNLTFAAYRMPASRNLPRVYDANERGPAPKRQGIRVGSLAPVGTGSPAAGAPGALAMTTLLALGTIAAFGFVKSRIRVS